MEILWGFQKGDTMTEWTCVNCELVKSVDANSVTGFDDWTGVLICPDCNSNMERKEDDDERNKSRST
jgi:uncharacterized Zn finger protein (UPF0148 family)